MRRFLPFRASLFRRRSLAVGAGILAAAALLAVILAVILARTVPLPARLAAPPSTVVELADGSPAFVFLSADDKYRVAADLEGIDPDYLAALLRFEDKRFYRHPGVDPLAVARAVVLNLRAGRVTSGASTITMQLVRVLEPRPRTLGAKAVEALRALQVEARMSKAEILAAYLTFIPFGRNVEGVTAASYAYFGHGPRDLSAAEIAVLLAVPQRPAERYPTTKNADRLRAARDEIATWLLDEGALPAGERPQRTLAAIRAEEVPSSFRPLPRHAPHAAFWLRARASGQGRARLATTLERGHQLLAERLLADAHPRLAALGIHNAAAVLIDHQQSEVRALVGNFDFWDAEHGGQIAGFAEARSPGSALKPFIYALAIDRGLALPEFLVPDVPVRYGAYAPDNYDGSFAGLVELEDALSVSLNVPFVRLLSRLGVERFAGTLRQMGVELVEEPGFYGLSAAIGALEVTPLELAGLYATLARDGGYRAPRVWRNTTDNTTNDTTDAPLPMFSPGAAHLTRRALARRDRPDFPERRRFSGAPARLFWKTGTSYGHRDAWAAGAGPRYTAVIWLGNFDNSPSVDLVGADAAGPLLFDLLEAVADRAAPRIAPTRPHDLKTVEVCALSGRLPTGACPRRREALALRQRVPTETCPWHVEVEVDVDSGLARNPSCRAGRSTEKRAFVVFPAELRRFLSERHRVLPRPPSLAADCQPAGARRAPQILSPPAGQVLVLVPGLAPSEQELPLVASGAVSGSLAWFVDGEFLGTVRGDDELWWTPSPGRHEIVVVDEAGLSARQVLEVREAG